MSICRWDGCQPRNIAPRNSLYWFAFSAIAAGMGGIFSMTRLSPGRMKFSGPPAAAWATAESDATRRKRTDRRRAMNASIRRQKSSMTRGSRQSDRWDIDGTVRGLAKTARLPDHPAIDHLSPWECAEQDRTGACCLRTQNGGPAPDRA